MRRRPWHYGIGEWLPGLLVLIPFIAVLTYFIWFHVTHVCVETRDYDCESSDCDFELDGVCMSWTTTHHTCTECIQWEKR